MFVVIQICFLLFAPFLFLGVINRVKALWAGRKGTPILQPFYDFLKLLRKGEVISKTTSYVFKIAPSVNIAAVMFAFLILPIPAVGAILNFPGDFLLFAYTLGLAKFFTVVAALDTGSSFEGMGASREVTFSSIVEPAFFILIGTLSLLTGQTSFTAIFALLNVSAGYTILVKSLFVVSLMIMLLTEGSRVPVDDPNTHLELTMIHEVMVLDYSGPDLAFILYSAGMKLVLISTLLADILISTNLEPAFALIIYFAIIFLIAVIIGLVESLIARARMSHVPQFIFLMTALSLTAFAVVIFFLRGGIK
ncbi:MAG: NADH-quinone oxidoreductase subunit H [Ignavibacteriales bacterium]|nr:NADH-quinone oxidoreductase subunit H [Ignavibacteriales bacterium]